MPALRGSLPAWSARRASGSRVGTSSVKLVAAGFAARTIEGQGLGEHDRDLRAVGEFDRLAVVLERVPDPDQELVAEEIEAGGIVARPRRHWTVPRRCRLTSERRPRSRFADREPWLAGVARSQTVGQAAGRDRLERPVEGLAEQGLKPVEDGRAGAAGVERVRLPVPEDRKVVEAAETAVGGFGLGA